METQLTSMEYSMKFDDLINYKSLHRQYVVAGGVLNEMMLESMVPEQKKDNVRNVCALISVPLFESLERTCAVLDITKRQFIEAALIECIARATPAVDQTEEVFVQASQREDERAA